MIIDMHVHYYLPEFVEAIKASDDFETYIRHDGRLVVMWRGGVTLTVPEPHPGVAQRIEMMDELGVDKQILSVPSPSAYFGGRDEARRVARLVNDGFADIAREHPHRFGGLAALPLKNVDDAIAELEYATTELGFAGAMVLTNIDGELLDAKRLEPFWAAASDMGALVYVHPTLPTSTENLQDFSLAIALGFFQETNLALSRLVFSGVFERHQGIRWVFSHMGGTMPFMFPRLDNYYNQFPECREHITKPPTEYLKELMYDTASTHVPALQCTCDTVGTNRMLFGSDFPHIPGGTGPYLQALEDLGLPPDDRSEVLGGRAQRVLDGGYA